MDSEEASEADLAATEEALVVALAASGAAMVDTAAITVSNSKSLPLQKILLLITFHAMAAVFMADTIITVNYNE